MILKIKFDFTHSLNLDPIIVDIMNKKEKENVIDVPVVTELATSCLQCQHFLAGDQVIFIIIN